MTLRRKLGHSTVLAIVMGDMIGSGIFSAVPAIGAITHLSTKKAVLSGATIFATSVSIAALLFFGSFSRIVVSSWCHSRS